MTVILYFSLKHQYNDRITDIPATTDKLPVLLSKDCHLTTPNNLIQFLRKGPKKLMIIENIAIKIFANL